MRVQIVIFSAPKDGNAPEEWEDGAFGASADGRDPRRARFVVVDGATEAYDVRRWRDLLVSSFMGSDKDRSAGQPGLDRDAMRAWFASVQDRWSAEAPAPADYIEQRKLQQSGSFATLLGCEINGLDGEAPAWRAVALGDTVLFHVRDGELIATFPDLAPGDFNTTPEVVHTMRASLDRMTSRLLFSDGTLAPGDVLFAATDALAQYIVVNARHKRLWPALASLCHPADFVRLIDDARWARLMTNDDVTLLRASVVVKQPSVVAICQ